MIQQYWPSEFFFLESMMTLVTRILPLSNHPSQSKNDFNCTNYKWVWKERKGRLVFEEMQAKKWNYTIPQKEKGNFQYFEKQNDLTVTELLKNVKELRINYI